MKIYCDTNVLRALCGGRAPDAAERHAVMALRVAINSGIAGLVSSYAIVHELSNYKNLSVRACCVKLLNLAVANIGRSRQLDRIRLQAASSGLQRVDAAHVACAALSNAALITFDAQMRAAARRCKLNVRVESPAQWLARVGGRLEGW